MTIPNPLTAAQKTQWLAELRSGRRQQCHGQLRRDGAHCCMGVLGEVLGKLDKRGRYRGWGPNYLRTSRAFEVLPKETQDQLAYMNDGGASFADIADWIEENVEAEG